MAHSTTYGMRASEITDLLDRILEPDKVNFLGVFARDHLPTLTVQTRFPACLVVNSAKSSEGGENWLALYFLDHTHCEYFDSYAFPYGFYGLTNYLSKFTITASSDHQLQSIDSSVCGHYCIFYLFHRSRGIPMYRILRTFSLTDKNLNDKHILEIVKSNFVMYHSHQFHSNCACPNFSCLSRTMLLSKCILLR